MAQNPDVTGREILPIPDRPSKGKMALDARKAEFPASRSKHPNTTFSYLTTGGATNVLTPPRPVSRRHRS